MSHKAFYQTFFQTEQLFRRADDALSFPVMAPAVITHRPATVIDRATPVYQPAAPPPAVTISDPVLPTPADRSAAPIESPLEPTPVLLPPTLPTPPVSEVLTTEPVTTSVPISAPEPVATMIPADTPEPAPAPVAPSTQPPVARRPATPLLSQKVLILVDEDLLPSDLLFLEKILKAVHLDITGVDLLNVHGTTNINFSEVLSGKYIHHFFTFGVPFNRINLDIMMDRYHPVRFEGITFLMADPLPAIESDVALKKKLWESLKKIFLWR